MNVQERKLDLENKLKYIGVSEQDIPKIIETAYSFWGIVFGAYKKLEKETNFCYQDLKRHEESRNINFYNKAKELNLLN